MNSPDSTTTDPYAVQSRRIIERLDEHAIGAADYLHKASKLIKAAHQTNHLTFINYDHIIRISTVLLELLRDSAKEAETPLGELKRSVVTFTHTLPVGSATTTNNETRASSQ